MLFSVIIPTYNRAEKLKVAIDSVLRQTYSKLELIIVDDGSTDDTEKLVKNYTDNRIIYHYQENSGLPSVGRNKGISKSSGDWICFLDSDDFWLENKLETVLTYIKKQPEVSVWSHSEYLIDQNNNIIKELFHFPKSKKTDYFEVLLFDGNFLSPSAITIKKQVLQSTNGFDTSHLYFSVEDYELWLRLSRFAVFGFIRETLGYYLVDGNGISSQTLKHMSCLKNVYMKNIPLLDLDEQKKEILLRNKLIDIDTTTARLFLKDGKFPQAKHLTYEILKKSLLRPKAMVIYICSLLKIRI